jgi:AcrR family transcriptional regulator
MPPKTSLTSSRASRAKSTTEHATTRKRMPPAERERQIIEGAISFFSDVGFSGQTRELARRIGVTQSLLYRYFSSKQLLIERVYEHVFLGRWDPHWITLIKNQKLPLRERLIEFYRQYAAATYQPEWIRIYIYAGLADTGLNKRYIHLIERELLSTLCIELRRYCGHGNISAQVSHEEMEFVWSLHGGMFYYAVRHFIFGADLHVDFIANATLVVDNFLVGVSSNYQKLLEVRPIN